MLDSAHVEPQAANTLRYYLHLNVVDAFTRECLAIDVAFSLAGACVAQILIRLVWLHGKPEKIVLDNGPEYTGAAMLKWSATNDVFLNYIHMGMSKKSFSSCPRMTAEFHHQFGQLN